MAIITYGAFAALLSANKVALAAASAPATADNYQALADLLLLMAAKKSMGQPPLIACPSSVKDQLNSAS